MDNIVHSLSALEIVSFALTALGGMLINFVNKAATEKLTWNEYWAQRPVCTIASFLVSIGIVVSLIISNETNHLTYLTAGFMADALINRASSGASNARGQAKK